MRPIDPKYVASSVSMRLENASAHAEFVMRATQEACKSTMEHRVGAVVVHRGAVVSVGYNHLMDHWSGAFSKHAEAAALGKLRNRHVPKAYLKACDVYVVRVGPATLKLARPCPRCEALIRDLGVRRVFYSD